MKKMAPANRLLDDIPKPSSGYSSLSHALLFRAKRLIQNVTGLSCGDERIRVSL